MTLAVVPVLAAALVHQRPMDAALRAPAVTSRVPPSVFAEAGRRRVLSTALASAMLPLVPQFALAGDVLEIEASTSRLGGKLEAFTDVGKGWSIYRPTSWNKFDANPGEYDAKFQDVVGVSEQVIVSSSPVSSGKGLDALGSAADLGAKVSKLRDLSLVSTGEMVVGGVPMYTVELAGQGGHELLGFAVSKGKLWRITCKTAESRWARNEEMYRTILTSFQPRIL